MVRRGCALPQGQRHHHRRDGGHGSDRRRDEWQRDPEPRTPRKVPQLAAANTFSGDQTVNGNLTATGTVGAAVLNAADESLSDGLSINSAANNPLYVATSASTKATAVYGVSTTTTTGGTSIGVEGLTEGSSTTSYGVVGDALATSGWAIGVYGLTNSSSGIGAGAGVFGQFTADESEGGASGNFLVGAGVWGDGGSGAQGGVGVGGSADSMNAGYFINNGSGASGATLYVENYNDSGYLFWAQSASQPAWNCKIDSLLALSCTGGTNSVVALDEGARRVALPAIESPQHWFEDFGSAQLVNGVAVVALDPDFIQTVNTQAEYHVFLTPNGECKGLSVINKTQGSFEVRELGGGRASIPFEYRIVAIRKNYENVRFADHTHDTDGMKLMQGRANTAAADPQACKRLIPPAAASGAK